MSTKSLTTPFIRHILKRGYASPAFIPCSEPKLECSTIGNKTIIAALDNGSPVTRVTVAFRAGSRYEPWSELGLTHVLRTSAGLTTGRGNGFILTRQMAQLGATISATGDREYVYYTLEASQENIPEAVDCLSKMISEQEFRPWELDDNAPRLRYDIVAIPPQVRAVDLLHRAAYRRGLGNSLFISPRKIGHISSESLRHFVANTCTPSRCAITVVGDNMERAQLIANSMQFHEAPGLEAIPAKYLVGECRKEMGGELSHVAIAVQGANAKSPDALALAIAARALGCGPVTKWGQSHSPLAKAMCKFGPFAAAGFSVSYSDTGLYGVIMSTAKDLSKHVVCAAANILKKPQLTESDIKIGKNQLKTQILSDADIGSALSETMAAEALYTGKVATAQEWANRIDQITPAQVQKAIQKAAESNLTMGAAGNLAFVPYVDEL